MIDCETAFTSYVTFEALVWVIVVAGIVVVTDAALITDIGRRRQASSTLAPLVVAILHLHCRNPHTCQLRCPCRHHLQTKRRDNDNANKDDKVEAAGGGVRSSSSSSPPPFSLPELPPPPFSHSRINFPRLAASPRPPFVG